MTQAFHPSLPGTLVAAGWDGATRPRRFHWGVNDTSSLRKARVNGPCSGPSAHGHELIFKSISLITRKSVARQIDLEFRIATPSLLYPSPPTFPRAEQSRAEQTHAQQEETLAPPHPVHCSCSPGTGQRNGHGCVFVTGHLGSRKNMLLSCNIGNQFSELKYIINH